MVRVEAVEVVEGLKEDFFKRHKKDRERAEQVWDALVETGDRLWDAPHAGTQIQIDRFPATFRNHPNLWKLDLPHAFRAVYTVIGRPGGGVRVAVEWIGDHGEYDKLFGYD